MDVSPPSPVLDPYEGLDDQEKTFARKKDIASDLRALVRHPGWQYLCTVLQQQAIAVKLRQASAGDIPGLLAMNLDMREAETYIYVLDMPQNIINEFTTDLEASE